MRRTLSIALLGAALAIACARPQPAAPPAQAACSTPPLFARDVRPVLERRCFGCHAGDGMAADDHDFSRFKTLYAQRNLVATELRQHAMPPPQAPPIAPEEARALLAWIDCGAKGD